MLFRSFIDLDSGGSVQGLIANLEHVLAEMPADAKVIPGHGPLGTKDDLRNFLDMLKGTSAAVKAAKAKGKTLDQMKKEKVLAKWDSWGNGFLKPEDFAEILYNDLTAKRPKKTGYHNHGHAGEKSGN